MSLCVLFAVRRCREPFEVTLGVRCCGCLGELGCTLSIFGNSPPLEGCRAAAGWSLAGQPPRHFAAQNDAPPQEGNMRTQSPGGRLPTFVLS